VIIAAEKLAHILMDVLCAVRRNAASVVAKKRQIGKVCCINQYIKTLEKVGQPKPRKEVMPSEPP
jgi:hypothetical protein